MEGTARTLLQQLTELKDEGNQAFKASDFAGAFALYTAAINKAREAELVDLDVEGSGNSAVQLVATVYANRSAVGLKLQRYEQVVHDAGHAVALMLTKGCSDSDLRMGLEVKSLYAKARIRRATAFEALGNFMQAYVDYMRGGYAANDTRAMHRANLMSETFTFPIRWASRSGDMPALFMPPAPAKRSSSNVDCAVVKQLKCRLPSACIFMQCVAWSGRIYVWGGGKPDPIDSFPSSKLSIVDPHKQSVALVDVQSDPNSQRLHGLPGHPIARFRHTAVLWHDAMYVHGGNLSGLESREGTQGYRLGGDIVGDESKTVWRLDLQAEPLCWQRIYAGGMHPPLRHDQSAVVWNDQLVVYGGESSGLADGHHHQGECGECWAFDLVHHTWRKLMPHPPLRRLGVPATAPEPRREHAAWVHGDWMYVFGGVSNCVQSATVERQEMYEMNSFTFPSMWRLHLTHLRWEQVHFEGNYPAARGEMGVAVSPRGLVYISGGYTTSCYTASFQSGRRSMLCSSYCNELFEFCCINHYWRRVVTADMQPALGALRSALSSCWVDNQVYVLGGYSSLSYPAVSHRTVLAIDVRVCAHCGIRKEDAPAGRLQQCARCKEVGRASVHYCSRECLNKDWPTHKIVCSDRGILK